MSLRRSVLRNTLGRAGISGATRARRRRARLEVLCGEEPDEWRDGDGITELAEIPSGPGSILRIGESRDQRRNIAVAYRLVHEPLVCERIRNRVDRHR